ncbi:MAG: hypothetical protein H3C31_02645 [Brumimicrobium sp.]|nr:hypothetical protein [Brumimicrobium sp.]MCO5268515.1 hypothetical protein [Brumimicrobium sp.]
MGAIIIETKSAEELKFVREMLKRTRIKNKELSKEDYEDFLLGLNMSIEKTGKKVSRTAIMKKLSSK